MQRTSQGLRGQGSGKMCKLAFMIGRAIKQVDVNYHLGAHIGL